MANETSWLGQKLWYVVLSALGATVAGGLAFGVHQLLHLNFNSISVVIHASITYGIVVGYVLAPSALLIAYPIYWFVLPPRSIVYSAAIGFGSGSLIMLGLVIFASAGRSGSETIFTWGAVLFMMWAGVCGAVFMAVLAWLTNRGLRTQADAASHGGGDDGLINGN